MEKEKKVHLDVEMKSTKTGVVLTLNLERVNYGEEYHANEIIMEGASMVQGVLKSYYDFIKQSLSPITALSIAKEINEIGVKEFISALAGSDDAPILAKEALAKMMEKMEEKDESATDDDLTKAIKKAEMLAKKVVAKLAKDSE